MADVIFNGSGSRKPSAGLRRALFDNTSASRRRVRRYNEIAIGVKPGATAIDYFLNKTRCRRKTLPIFSRHRSRAAGVIDHRAGHGRASSRLTEDLRGFIEEAAGNRAKEQLRERNPDQHARTWRGSRTFMNSERNWVAWTSSRRRRPSTSS
jgi:hypothetical protein